MSIKNLPLTTYLDAKGFVRTAILTKIKEQKENVMNLQIIAYELKLSEEMAIAIAEFQEINTPSVDEPSLNAEFELKREAFIAELEKEKIAKVKELTLELTKKLKNEMAQLQTAAMTMLVSQHTGPVTVDSLASIVNEFLNHFKNPYQLFSFLLKCEHAKLFKLTSFANKLYINSFIDPRLMLFITRTGGTSLRLHEKFSKVKSKKFKMKRRKVRKLYVFRKLKKVILFRKLKKRYFTKGATNDIFRILQLNNRAKNLIKRIPVSARVIEATAVEFFYKLNKKFNNHLAEDFAFIEEEVTDFLIYLRNYHQKPYFKFRKARIAHWKLFFNKTLRQQRYKGFLRRFVKKYEQVSYTLNFLVNFFTKVKLSWTRCGKLESFLKLYVVEYTNSIVRIPLIFTNFFKWDILKRRSYLLRKKMGRWSYLNFRRATCPWLQRKKNTPKISYHIQPNLQYFNSISYWDFMTGFLYLEEDLKVHSLPVVNQFKSNLLTKLHIYRYKANKKCMLL